MRLSNSKANTFNRCRRRYKFKYVEKLRPKTPTLPLKRGDWLHQMLMHHYDGEGWEGIHKELTKGFNTLFEEEREEYGDLPAETKRIMRSYLRHYEKEDQNFAVIDSELDEILVLPNGDEFNFIIDLIVEDLRTHQLWLIDHKTVDKFMKPDFMLIDSQLARYFWAATKMGYTPLAGVMFNEIRTKPPAVPKVLKKGGLSQRKDIDTDYYTYALEIKRQGEDPNDYLDLLKRLKANTEKFHRRTRMPKDKPLVRTQMRELMETAADMRVAEENERYPRTAVKACDWDCDYKDLCITELFGGDYRSIVKMKFDEGGRKADAEVEKR